MSFKMTKTQDERKKILDYLLTGSSLTGQDAKALFQVNSLGQRIHEIKGLGHKVTKTTKNGHAAYMIDKSDMVTRPKSIRVSEEVHLLVKNIALQTAMNGKPQNEKEIYIQAVEIGIKELKKKHLNK
jgi:hypothetical protein